jgi:hypothetical protein
MAHGRAPFAAWDSLGGRQFLRSVPERQTEQKRPDNNETGTATVPAKAFVYCFGMPALSMTMRHFSAI